MTVIAIPPQRPEGLICSLITRCLVVPAGFGSNYQPEEKLAIKAFWKKDENWTGLPSGHKKALLVELKKANLYEEVDQIPSDPPLCLKSYTPFSLNEKLKLRLKETTTPEAYELLAKDLLDEAKRKPDNVNVTNIGVFFKDLAGKQIFNPKLRSITSQASLYYEHLVNKVIEPLKIEKYKVNAQIVRVLVSGIKNMPVAQRNEMLTLLSPKLDPILDFHEQGLRKMIEKFSDISNIPPVFLRSIQKKLEETAGLTAETRQELTAKLNALISSES